MSSENNNVDCPSCSSFSSTPSVNPKSLSKLLNAPPLAEDDLIFHMWHRYRQSGDTTYLFHPTFYIELTGKKSSQSITLIVKSLLDAIYKRKTPDKWNALVLVFIHEPWIESSIGHFLLLSLPLDEPYNGVRLFDSLSLPPAFYISVDLDRFLDEFYTHITHVKNDFSREPSKPLAKRDWPTCGYWVLEEFTYLINHNIQERFIPHGLQEIAECGEKIPAYLIDVNLQVIADYEKV
jgi:hypothetical protein